MKCELKIIGELNQIAYSTFNKVAKIEPTTFVSKNVIKFAKESDVLNRLAPYFFKTSVEGEVQLNVYASISKPTTFVSIMEITAQKNQEAYLELKRSISNHFGGLTDKETVPIISEFISSLFVGDPHLKYIFSDFSMIFHVIEE